MSRIRERDLYQPVVEFLGTKPRKQAQMCEIRNFVKSKFSLSREDLSHLLNRGDQKFEQIVRNIRCHSKSPGNPIGEGLIEPIKGGLRLTDRGYRLISETNREDK